MKKLLCTLPLFLVAASQLKAADTPIVSAPSNEAVQTYAQIMEIAESHLSRARRAERLLDFGDIIPHVMNAANAFERAAKVAPDDAKKHDALSKAGDYFIRLDAFDKAANAYDEALKIASLSPAQKNELLLLRADTYSLNSDSDNANKPTKKRVRELYQQVFDEPTMPIEKRARAKEGMAGVWLSEFNLLNALVEYEATTRIAGLDTSRQIKVLQRAFETAGSWGDKKSSPEIVAVLERILSRRVELQPNKPDKVRARFEHAELINQYGGTARAYAIWNALSDDATIPISERARAVAQIATQRVVEKQPQLALKEWERVTSWPKPQAGDAGYPYRRAISLADTYYAMGEETKARVELAIILTWPSSSEFEKTLAHYRIGLSHLREMEKLKASSTQPDAATKTRIDNSEKSAFAAMNAALAIGAKNARELRYLAASELAKIEVDKKRYPQARAFLQPLLDEFTSAPNAVSQENLFPLVKNIASTYYSEKLYGDAAAVLKLGIRWHGEGQEYEAKEAKELIAQLWTESRQQKSWDEARQIMNIISGMGWNEADFNRGRLEVEVGAQNWKEAAKALLAAQDILSTMKEEEKKVVNDLGAKIPADVVAQARNDAAATKIKASAG